MQAPTSTSLVEGLRYIPNARDDSGRWDLRGHRSRILTIDTAALSLFAALYDEANTPPAEARLPVLANLELLRVLRALGDSPTKLGSLAPNYYFTEHFNESTQQKQGTIARKTCQPSTPGEIILSGPHIHIGCAFNKSPNPGCSSHRDYSPVDLVELAATYLPLTNYVPACTPAVYRQRTPQWRSKPVTSHYRWICRKMIAAGGERTLISAILFPGPAHIDGCFSFIFESNALLAEVCALACSLVFDFWTRATGKSNFRNELAAQLPLPDINSPLLRNRALRLNCITSHYADLWHDVATAAITDDGFAKNEPRLPSWSHLTTTWHRDSALRTPYERRQALVELDALAALSLGLTEEQLLLIYRVQFPVLQQYERETFYDQRGKIIFTVNKGLSGVGLTRAQWEEVKHAKAGDKLPDFARDAGGPFVPPFDSCDREQDMSQAYRHFARLLGKSDLPDTPIGSVRKPSTPPPPTPAANDVAKPAAKSARR